MEKAGCSKLFVIAIAAGEIAAFIAMFDLVVGMSVERTAGTTIGNLKVVLLIAACLTLPTAAGAHAYLAETQKGVVVALATLIVFPFLAIGTMAALG